MIFAIGREAARPGPLRWAFVVLAGTAAAASAGAAEPATTPPPPLVSVDARQCREGPQVPPVPLRRLTRFEYDNTIAALFGAVEGGGQHFPEEGGSGFDNNADLSVAARIHAQKYLTAAERIAARVTTDLPALLGCKPEGTREHACVKRWIARMGAQLWRRPLTAAEHAAQMRLYRELRATHDTRTTVRLLLTGFLESPRFLYRIEDAPAAKRTDTTVVPLDDHAIATRLSYFILGGPPDAWLTARATRGRLHTQADVRLATRRLLRDPRARVSVHRFFDQWMGVTLLERLQKELKKDAAQPSWRQLAVAPLMRTQWELFIDHVVWEGEGTWAALLTSPVTFVNGPLATFLGMDDVAKDDAFIKTTAGGEKRAGLLTLSAFLAMQAKVNETSPIKRGIFVREQLLCQIPPPPPPNLMMTELPPPSPELQTMRDRLEDHRMDMGCNKCHRLFDPLGLAFEHYDTVGAWRALENDRPIDASGEVVASDIHGSFSDLPELARQLAGSEQVADCAVRQWFRYALGRTEGATDACTLAGIASEWQHKGRRITALIEAIAASDAFLYRATDAVDLALSSDKPEAP